MSMNARPAIETDPAIRRRIAARRRIPPCGWVAALLENHFAAVGIVMVGVAVSSSPAYSYLNMSPDGQQQGALSHPRPSCAPGQPRGARADGRVAVEPGASVPDVRRPVSSFLPRRLLRENAGAKPEPRSLLNSRPALTRPFTL